VTRLVRAAVGLAIVAAACGGEPATPPTASEPGTTATPTVVPATCAEIEHPVEQGGGHLVEDATPPVPYSSTPGTSGWHAGGAVRQGVFTEADALLESQIVAVLEVGGVVAAYDPDELDDVSLTELVRLAEDEYAGDLTVTPFDGDMGAPLVLNAWATRRPCTGLVAADLAAFIEEYAGVGPGH